MWAAGPGSGSSCRPAPTPPGARRPLSCRPSLAWRPGVATSGRLGPTITITTTRTSTRSPSIIINSSSTCTGASSSRSSSKSNPLSGYGCSSSSGGGGGGARRLPPARASRRSSSSKQPSGGSSGWAPNPMELVRREAGLQSNRLDSALRERVEEAVERLGGRVTLGDVAARAGVKLADADEALKALAYDTAASLKVSSEGEVVYGFAPDFRSRLRNRSLLIAAAPQLRRLAGALSYLARVAFGTTLIASVVVVWLAILALLSGRSDDRDDRRHRGSGVTFLMDPIDLFLYWDPYYYRKRAAARSENQDGSGMNFVEAVFSWVFGDGDPNDTFDERRWRELGSMIRKKGGVVAAEEMAPFLEPPPPAPLPRAGGSGEPYVPYPDESFILPALIKFGGEPEVDEQGRILYRFPALQRTGVQQPQRLWGWRRGRGGGADAGSDSWSVPLERPWDLTAASSGQVAGVVTLGLLNLVGVALLSGLLADPRGPALLAMQGLGWVGGLMGPLRLYAAAFFAVPAIRWFLNQLRNRDIEQRNDAREAAVEVISASASAPPTSPMRAIAEKVESARSLAEAGWTTAAAAAAEGTESVAAAGRAPRGPRLVRADDIIFDSGREVGRQTDELGVDDWDRRMSQRERERERGQGWGRGRG